MTTTTKEDYVVPEVYLPYAREFAKEKSPILNSGIVQMGSSMDSKDRQRYEAMLNSKGVKGQVPKITKANFNWATPNENRNDRITPGGSEFGEDAYCKYALNGATSISGAAEMMTGENFEDDLVNQAAEAGMYKMEELAFKRFTGIFDVYRAVSASKPELGLDRFLINRAVAQTETVTDANRITRTLGIQSAIHALGDQHSKLKILSFHTDVYNRLFELGLLDKELKTINGELVEIKTFMGYKIYYSDMWPRARWDNDENGIYKVYLTAPNLVKLLIGAPDKGLPAVKWKFDEEGANGAGILDLMVRTKALCHIDGISSTHDIPNTNTYPTDDDYFLASNWDVTAKDRRHIPAVEIAVNL